jgi:hypothetical protein
VWNSWVPVVHTCNLAHSGGKDQEDCRSKPVLGKLFLRPYFKNNHHRKRLVE